jgi:hypothetical protein
LGHLNSYDTDERSADNVASKVVGVEPKNTLTDSQKNDFLSYLEDKYQNLPDAKEATEMLSKVDDSDKEDFAVVPIIWGLKELVTIGEVIILAVAAKYTYDESKKQGKEVKPKPDEKEKKMKKVKKKEKMKKKRHLI